MRGRETERDRDGERERQRQRTKELKIGKREREQVGSSLLGICMKIAPQDSSSSPSSDLNYQPPIPRRVI